MDFLSNTAINIFGKKIVSHFCQLYFSVVQVITPILSGKSQIFATIRKILTAVHRTYPLGNNGSYMITEVKLGYSTLMVLTLTSLAFSTPGPAGQELISPSTHVGTQCRYMQPHEAKVVRG